MRRSIIDRRLALCAAALAGVVLALPLASQAKTPTAPGKPIVATGGVAHATPSAGTLDGSVDPHGAQTTYYFQYGPTIAYGSQTTPGTLASSMAKVKVGQEVKGVVTGYHYRLVASNSYGTAVGRDRIYSLKSQKLSVTLAKVTGQHLVGSSLLLTGAVTGTGNAGHKVELQANAYPYGEGFHTLGAIQTTDATGHFSFSVSNLTASTQYRIATVDPRPAYSKTAAVLVTVRVTFHVRTTRAHPGLVRLYGTVSPAQSGAHVLFQLQKPPKTRKAPKSEKAEEKAEENPFKYSTQFTAPVKRATRSLSRFSLVVSVRHAGHYRALVEVRKGPLAQGYSSTITLRAAPASAKKRGTSK